MNRKAWVYAAAFMNLYAFNSCYVFRALRQEAEYWFSGAKQLHLDFLPQYTWILGWHNCLSSPLSPSPQRKHRGLPCYNFWALAAVLGAFCSRCLWQGGQTGPAMVEHQNLALFLSPTLGSFESCYTEEPSLRIINRANGMGCAIRTLCLPCLDWNVQSMYNIGSNPLSPEKSPFSFCGSRSLLLKGTAMAKLLQEIQAS